MTPAASGRGSVEALVVGAGPAGASAAWELARSGVRVRILEVAEFPRSKPCGDAISPGAIPLLREMGVERRLEATGAARVRGWRIRSPDGFWFRGRYADPTAASPAWGYAMPRAELDALLLEAAVEAGAEFFPGHRVVGLREERGRVTAAIARDGRGREGAHPALMVMGADGLRSRVARALGSVRRGRRRRLALVGRFGAPSWDHGGLLANGPEHGEMRLARGGLVGLAPIGRGRWNATLVVPSAEGPAMSGDVAGFYRSRLTEYGAPPELADVRLRARLEVTGPFELYPSRITAPGAVLAGDAAGYFDPFTGQGVYRALVTGRMAARVVSAALEGPEREAAARRRYVAELRRLLAPGRRVQKLVDAVVFRPRVMNGVARLLTRRPALADLLVDVTGDRLSPGALASPARLLHALLPAGYQPESRSAYRNETG